MNERDDALLDEQVIEESLAGLRPDADEFSAAVARRIRARREMADAEGADRESVARRAGWPRWLRRAAGILPPGVTESAIVGKMAAGGGGSGAKVAAGAGGLVVGPVMLVTIALAGVLGAFGATRKLDASATTRADVRRAPVYFLIGLCWAIGIALVFVAVFSVPLVKAAIIGSLLIGAMVVTARVLSAAGLAHRERVGAAMIGVFTQGMMFVYFGLDLRAASTVSMVTLPLFAMGALVVGLLLPRGSRARIRGLWVGCLTVALASMLTFGIAGIGGPPFGTTQQELVTWVNNVDVSPDDLSTWQLIGDATRCLEPAALQQVDRERLRASIEAGIQADDKRLHPRVAIGAMRMGVLPERAFDDQTDWVRRDRIVVYDHSTLGGDEVLDFDIAVLRRDGRFDEQARAILRDLVARSWPAPGAFSCLETAAACAEAAELLGATDLLATFAEQAPAVMASAWVGRRAPASLPVGFESCRSEDTSVRIASDTRDTLAGVLLMRRFGVPTSVDLGQLDRYLTREMASRDHVSPLPGRVEAALARLLVRRDIGLPPVGLAGWAMREPMFVFVLLALLLAVWITCRAPMPPSIEEGPMVELSQHGRA